MLLKQSTARNLSVFMTDSADHVTGKTGLTLTITASKDGAAFASITPTVTELADGWYSLALTTTHTNTLGDLAIHITSTGADPTDLIRQVVVDLPGASVSSVTGAVGSVTGNVGGNVTGSVGSVATGGITAASFAANAITAAKLDPDVTTELQAGLATSGAVSTLQTSVDDLPTNAELATALGTADDAVLAAIAGLNNLSAAQVNAEVDTAIADARLDELLAADSDIDGAAPPAVGSVFHELMTKSTGSFTFDQTTDSLEAVRDRGDAAWITATGFSTLDAAGVRSAVGLASADLDTQLGALPTAAENADAVWEEALGDHSGTTGSTAEALGAAGAAGDPWTTLLPGAYGAGSAGKIIGDNIDAAISSRLATAGYTAPLDAAGTRTAVGLASANLDTQIDGLPTAAENATAVWGAGTRVLTAGTNIVLAKGTGVTGFNDLSAAQVNAEADTALSDVGVTTTVTGRIDAAISTRASQTSVDTIDDFVDTEVGAIKTVTDKLDTAVELDGVVYRFTTNALEQAPSGGGGATAADIADAVWEEAIVDHSGTVGSTAEALTDAGAGGNPWNTALEGAFTAGDIMRILAAVAAGKDTVVNTGSGTATVTFRSIDDAEDRVVGQMAASRRVDVTLTP